MWERGGGGWHTPANVILSHPLVLVITVLSRPPPSLGCSTHGVDLSGLDNSVRNDAGRGNGTLNRRAGTGAHLEGVAF